MKDFLMVILTIPLIDTSLQMDLYKIHNLPTLYPELKVWFNYKLEGKYLAISKSGIYAALPAENDIVVCQATGGYLCMMNQALYPIEKIEWCVYALFKRDYRRITENCVIETEETHTNTAQSLDGYMWAISSLKREKIQIRCLLETTVQVIKPPLTILYVGNGCEAYSTNIYIPAKSEITSHDPELTRHTFFLEFNQEYQNLTKYSLIKELHLEQLTPEEKAELPGRLTALPPLRFDHLKKRIKPLPPDRPPFRIHPNIVLIILLVAIFVVVITLGFLVWHIYKVRSRVKGFKPMAKLFTSNQGTMEENIMQLLSLITNPVSHVAKSLLALPEQPHVSTTASRPILRPQPPLREAALPVEDIALTKQVTVSEETLHDVMRDLQQESKFKGYRKYLQKQAKTTELS